MRAPLRSVCCITFNSFSLIIRWPKVFLWLVSLVTTAGILSWIVIGLTYLRFYNALHVQGIPRDRLPYKGPFQPYITVCDFLRSLEGLVFKPLDSTMPLLWIRLYWYSAAGFHLYLPSRYHFSSPTTSTGKLTQKCRQNIIESCDCMTVSYFLYYISVAKHGLGMKSSH